MAGSRRGNTFFAFAVQISTAAATAALTLVLLRVLDTSAYGDFALALAIASLVALPADLGLSGAAARFLAESKDDRAATHATLVSGLRLKLVISLAAGGALFVAAGPIAAAYGEPGLGWPLRAMAIAVLGGGVMRFCLVCFSVRERNSLAFVAVASESVAELAASVALVLVFGGATAAAFGRAIGYTLGLALSVVLVARLFDLPLWRLLGGRGDRATARRLAGYGGAMAIADGVWAVFNQIDLLLIGAILSSTAVAVFQAPLRVLVLVSYPGLALGAAVGPRLARVAGRERPDPAPLVGATRTLVIVQTLAAAFVIAWAAPLSRTLLGSSYGESAHVFVALGPYVVLGGLAPLLSMAITYVGGTKRRIQVAVLSLAANAAIDAVLLPRIGVVGAAIGTDVGFAIYVVGHLLVGARQIDFSLDRIAATFVRCAIAFVPAAALLLAGAHFGLAASIPAAVAAIVVYVAVVYALGETTIRPWLRLGADRVRALRRPLRPATADQVRAT